MEEIQNILFISLVLLNFGLLGSSRLMVCIRSIALQALLFGVLALLQNPGADLPVTISLIVTTLIKAGLIPWMIRRTTLKVGVKRELEPYAGYVSSLLAGVILLGIALLLTKRLNLNLTEKGGFFMPVAFFTIMCGLFLIIARKKAVTQVLGYLALENGIYAFGISLQVSEPFLIEMGILLDVFAAIFIMGITIYHINKEFDHIDIHRLSAGKGGR